MISTAGVSRAGSNVECVLLVIEIDIHAGLRLEDIADARDMPPVDLMRVRPERDHAERLARVVKDIEPDAPRIMAAAHIAEHSRPVFLEVPQSIGIKLSGETGGVVLGGLEVIRVRHFPESVDDAQMG